MYLLCILLFMILIKIFATWLSSLFPIILAFSRFVFFKKLWECTYFIYIFKEMHWFAICFTAGIDSFVKIAIVLFFRWFHSLLVGCLQIILKYSFPYLLLLFRIRSSLVVFFFYCIVLDVVPRPSIFRSAIVSSLFVFVSRFRH